MQYKQQLNKWYLANRLPHAILLVGSVDVSDFVNLLLCDSKTNVCGQCHSCKLFINNTHPDIYNFLELKIDQVRSIINNVATSPQIAQYKIILIHALDAINDYAANALLKVLEEPISNTIFMLFTNKIGSLPKTIISRCQILRIPQDKIQLDENGIIMQQDLLSNNLDVTNVATKWLKLKIPLRVILENLLLIMYYRDKNNAKFEQEIYRQLRFLHQVPQLNGQLLLESLLTHYPK